jgi:hypothetical protein
MVSKKGDSMKGNKVLILLAMSIFFLYFCVCTLPTDPAKNPKYARIMNENITSLSSVLPMGTVFKCTLVVFLPALVDSYVVKKNTNSGTSIVASGDSVGDTVLFTIDFLQPDDYLVSIYLYKANYTDTLQKQFKVFSTVPLSLFSTNKVTMYVRENTSFPFTLSDPDSNLMTYFISRNGIVNDTVDVKVANRASLNGTILPDSGTKLQKNNIYVIKAVDVDSQFSKSAICTVTVMDTTHPTIKPLFLAPDSKLTISSLPCTLGVVISDDWCIDSVKVSGIHWNLPKKDTLWVIKSFVDTGLTKDSIEVWDRGLNRTVFKITLKYHGIVQHPPMLKAITIAPIFERESFDTLYLDSFVVITDTASHYSKDSLKWAITADSTDSLLKHSFDPVKRALVVTVLKTEIGHDRYTSITIKVTDPKGLSDVLNRVAFWVMEKNDAPVIKVKNQSKLFGSSFDTLKLDSCGFDSDPSDLISWKIEAGKYFKPDSIYRVLNFTLAKAATYIKKPLRTFTGKVAIIPDTTKFNPSLVPIGTTEIVDSLKFIASDGDVTSEKYIRFTWNRLQIIKTGIELKPEL